MIDLAFATNQELVRELMKRHSFVGVLIYRPQTMHQWKERGKNLSGKYKEIRTPNLTLKEAAQITRKAADVLDKRCLS